MKTSVSFKSICIQFALVLSFLLALSPFLHAHYGSSKMTGLHVAGVSSVATGEALWAVTSFSQDDEQESAAVGVETSYSRPLTLDVQEQPQSVLLLTVFVLAALTLLLLPALTKPSVQRAGRLSFLAGFPPLPHAPPTFRF